MARPATHCEELGNCGAGCRVCAGYGYACCLSCLQAASSIRADEHAIHHSAFVQLPQACSLLPLVDFPLSMNAEYSSACCSNLALR